MPVPQTLRELLETAQRSGLISLDESQRLTKELPADSNQTQQDAAAQAAQLVEKQVLTRFQADQLLAGKGEECVLAGRYRILEPLGAGGMGAVYKALDTKLDRPVAIKVMAAQHVSNPDAIARFHREARALAKVSHPGVVQAYDHGEDRGRQFLVMEYVEGHSLLKVLHELGRLPATLAADYTYQTAVALHHAHARGLIHRDIKPANLLLTPERRVRVLDLGLARFVQDQVGDAGLTREGVGMGTPDYMAPEQFRDAHTADLRSDIYALGCTLYHLMTGQVPFPGSSLSEKAAAHESKDPPPVEARCPDAPSGLVLAVHKMLAKKPDKRFQTAGEVAEALALYVASSSIFAIKLKETRAWEGSQLSILLEKRPAARKARPWAWMIGGAAAAVALVLLSFVGLWWLNRSPEATPSRNAGLASEDGNPDTEQNLLTVSMDPKDGGQFRTITAALEKVKPGQTIRVLDDGTYEESLPISSASRHAGITLEAPRSATIKAPLKSPYAVAVLNVPRVTLRGFRLRGGGTDQYLLVVLGQSPGVLADELDLQPDAGINGAGVVLDQLKVAAEEPPVVVQNCRIQEGMRAIRLSGEGSRCEGVVIRNNRIVRTVQGIISVGGVRRLQVVGNQIYGASVLAIQLTNLTDQSRDILIANNTFFQCGTAFRLWDASVTGQNVQVRNNLVLGASGPDMVYLDSGGNPQNGELVVKAQGWRLDSNWREVMSPTGGADPGNGWIPPTANDVRKDQITVGSREENHAAFLRPAKDSPLAKSGAGGDLPAYVGALPPEGVEPWDWQKTWESRHPKMLLTVSKDQKVGGEFRTINEALAKVTRPGMTVRVLDDAIYNGAVNLRNRDLHQGLTIEAPRGATLEVPPGVGVGLVIMNVPRVTVRGLAVRTSQAGSSCVGVGGLSSGVVLESLHCHSTTPVRTTGVILDGLGLTDDRVLIQSCTFTGLSNGIEVVGLQLDTKRATPCRRVAVVGNRIGNCTNGIWAAGRVSDLMVAGNRIWNSSEGSIRLDSLMEGSARILIANNSIKATRHCVEVIEPARGVGDVQIINNVLVADGGFDIVRLGGETGIPAGWQIDHNWRQVRRPAPDNPEAKEWLESARDTVLDKLPLVSLDPSHKDFCRAAGNSPLATGGLGGDLPTYAGAVPPEGVEPWDWNKTWQARDKR